MRKIIFIVFFMAMAQFGFGQAPDSFPYPQLPDTLRTVQERGKYLLTHYWDAVDFNDAAQLNDINICEQGFVDFIDLFPRLANAPFLQESMDLFAKRAFSNGAAKKKFQALVEQYLDAQHSPMRNDVTYGLLLKAMLQQPGFDEAERTQLAFVLRNVEKNQVGTTATDFSFTDRQGKAHRLSDYQGQRVVLFFYHPDCEICQTVAEQLKKAGLPEDLTVLAIYPDDDTALWRQTRLSFPATWVDGYSISGEIEKEQTYYIRATPSLYLLDKGNTVRLKDAEVEALLATVVM